jgi:signal transduction histidine kinase
MLRFKKYLDYFKKLIYGESASAFEDRLSLLTSISVTIILVFSTMFNVVTGLKNSLIISSFLGAIIYFGLYLLGRFVNRGKLFFLLFSIISLFYLDIIWYLNYGSNGPILPLFVVFYAFLILIFNRTYYVFISLILFLNLLGMYLVESVHYNEIGNYLNIETKLSDNYMGMVFSLLVIFSFVVAIKKNYIHEQERARMSDRLKSAFLANMSHEIRTPLNAIVGFSSLMTEPDLTEDDKKMFREQVQSNSEYLISLIEDIIDVSKIESNQLTIKLQEINVVPLITKIVQTFQLAIASNKNVRVVTKLGATTILVTVDQVRLEQILRNLLANAIKFTDDGVIEVDCEKGNDFYTFSVKDTGIGIHLEHQLAIFERFRKIDNNKQIFHRGTGIGLFLSKQLVELLGGKIWVESEVGEGSTFYFTIPA